MKTSTLISLAVAVVLGLAAVLGLRFWLAEQRAEWAATGQRGGAPEFSIVVAKEPMRFGERVLPEKIQVIPWATATLPDGAFRSIEEMGGDTEETARFVLSAIEKGEPVLASRITMPGQRAKLSTSLEPGAKAVSIRVNDVAGVAGFVLPGDRVDVLLTRAGNSGEEAYVDVLLQGVRVLAIDQIADDRKDQPSVVRTVTFEVSTEEAQKLTLGSAVGTLSLALRNVVSSDVVESRRVTLADMSKTSAAAELAREIELRTEAERAAMQEAQDAQMARIAELEEQVRSLGGDVESRLEALRAEMAQTGQDDGLPKVLPAPVVVEEPPAPPQPVTVTVGVMRNGERFDYVVTSSRMSAAE